MQSEGPESQVPVGEVEGEEPDTEALARELAQMCYERRAEDLVILDLDAINAGITDYFVLATGTSSRQLKAIADFIRRELKSRGQMPLGVEGYEEASWILLDYGDVVLHLFLPETRSYYNLEFLWSRAPRLAWEPILPEGSEDAPAPDDLPGFADDLPSTDPDTDPDSTADEED